MMERYILVPDSFKGTMSSTEVCDIMAEQICKHRTGAEVISIPVADSGEGSTACFLSASRQIMEDKPMNETLKVIPVHSEPQPQWMRPCRH